MVDLQGNQQIICDLPFKDEIEEVMRKATAGHYPEDLDKRIEGGEYPTAYCSFLFPGGEKVLCAIKFKDDKSFIWIIDCEEEKKCLLDLSGTGIRLYETPNLSPDGKNTALPLAWDHSGKHDIFLIKLDRLNNSAINSS